MSSMRCFQCKGPYHPATGDYDKKRDVAFCGPCYAPFVAWLKQHLNRVWGGSKFYDHSSTSIRPGVTPYVILEKFEKVYVKAGKPKTMHFTSETGRIAV